MTTSPEHLDDTVGAVWRDVYSTFFLLEWVDTIDWIEFFPSVNLQRQLFGLEKFTKANVPHGGSNMWVKYQFWCPTMSWRRVHGEPCPGALTARIGSSEKPLVTLRCRRKWM